MKWRMKNGKNRIEAVRSEEKRVKKERSLNKFRRKGIKQKLRNVLKIESEDGNIS